MAGTNGYRVGMQCYPTEEAATDHLISQVVPVVTANGTLAHPVKQGAVWQYNGHQIQLTLPECDPTEDFNDGLTVAAYIIGLMFIAFVFKVAIRMIKATDTGTDYDD